MNSWFQPLLTRFVDKALQLTVKVSVKSWLKAEEPELMLPVTVTV